MISATSRHSVVEAANRLEDSRRTGVPCSPVRDVIAADDLDTAYGVQAVLTARRIEDGARIVGRKIGLTNSKVQAQLGVDQPDFGVLFDDMNCEQDVPIDVSRLQQPKIEAEIAFLLDADLDMAPVTAGDVVAATSRVVAALEIVDSRIAGWDISIADTIADNGSSGLFVLGSEPVGLAGRDLPSTQMTLRRGNETVSEGSGADCLGDPVAAVVWLANAARDYGTPLRAGEIVLSGALGPMVPVTGNSVFTAQITDIGTVQVAFTVAEGDTHGRAGGS